MTAICLLAATCGALAACEDMGGRKMPANRPQQESAPTAEGPQTGTSSVRTGSSTLGKARDSAVRVGDKVDDYNRRIEEAAEGVGK